MAKEGKVRCFMVREWQFLYFMVTKGKVGYLWLRYCRLNIFVFLLLSFNFFRFMKGSLDILRKISVNICNYLRSSIHHRYS